VAGVKEIGTIPVPERAIVCGLLFALSVIVNIALSALVVTGLNATLKIHVA
jgi:hypothetical protein